MSTVISITLTFIFAASSLMIHEFAHILAVNYLGGRVEKVGVLPLGLRAQFRGLEKLHAWERYVIYSAGSIANVITAAWTFSVSRMSYFGIPWLEELALFNIVLCVFNLIPALPLDGGRILKQFLSNRIGMLRANRIMLKLGLCISIFLIFLGFLQVVLYSYNITLLCAAMYIRRQNKEMKPALQMEFFNILDRKKAPARSRLVPVKIIHIPDDATLKFALERLTMDHRAAFYIAGKCVFSEQELIVHIFENGLHGTAQDCIVSNLK